MRAEIYKFLQRIRPTRRLVVEPLVEVFRSHKIVRLPPAFLISQGIGSEEPIFDSFSLEGEAFGGRLHMFR